jgi:hypothetical protein
VASMSRLGTGGGSVGVDGLCVERKSLSRSHGLLCGLLLCLATGKESRNTTIRNMQRPVLRKFEQKMRCAA